MSGTGDPASSRPKLVVGLIGVAAACWITGKLGMLVMPPGYPPAVGVPAAIGLVVVLVGGYRFAGSLALGTFLFQFFQAHGAGTGTGLSALIALGIAAGAVAQAAVGVWLVRRVVSPAPSRGEAREVG